MFSKASHLFKVQADNLGPGSFLKLLQVSPMINYPERSRYVFQPEYTMPYIMYYSMFYRDRLIMFLLKTFTRAQQWTKH